MRDWASCKVEKRLFCPSQKSEIDSFMYNDENHRFGCKNGEEKFKFDEKK